MGGGGWRLLDSSDSSAFSAVHYWADRPLSHSNTNRGQRLCTPHPPTTTSSSSSCTPGWSQTLLTPWPAADRAVTTMNLNLNWFLTQSWGRTAILHRTLYSALSFVSFCLCLYRTRTWYYWIKLHSQNKKRSLQGFNVILLNPEPHLLIWLQRATVLKAQSPNSPLLSLEHTGPLLRDATANRRNLQSLGCRNFSPSCSKILSIGLCARLVSAKVALKSPNEPRLTHIGPHPRLWAAHELCFIHHSRAVKTLILSTHSEEVTQELYGINISSLLWLRPWTHTE